MASLSLQAEQLLAAARAAGADAADALVTADTSVSVDVLGGALEHAERAEGIELGLRVFVGARQASVSTSNASKRMIEDMATRAVAMAREAPEDPYAGLAEPDQLADAWDVTAMELADPASEPPPDALQSDAIRAEAAALAIDGVSQVSSSSAGYGHREMYLAATNGFQGGYSRTSRNISCVAITGEGTGMERDYCGEARTFQCDLPDAEEVGRIAGERTVERAGARKPPTGAFPVLYDERVASSLIGHLLSAANGGAVARGASWLLDAMDAQVLPAHLSILEDPHRTRVSGSKPFDAEGLPTAPRAIVESGRLTSWTLDLARARQLGLASTGNAARSGATPPRPSNHNIALTSGDTSRETLIRDMGEGLLVTSMIGSSISETTGNYSRGASGFWIENGEIAYPVNECTIAGNLRDMLMTLVPANDARPHLSRVVPSCLVEGLTIAGA